MVTAGITSKTVLCLSSYVVADHIAQSTNIAQDGLDPRGWTLKPTTLPVYDSLAIRQASGALFEPTSFCGYVNGASGNSIACDSDYYCTTFSQNSTWCQVFGCCPTSSLYSLSGTAYLNDCGLPTTCLDSTQLTQSYCPTSGALFCSASQAPYCQYYVSGQLFSNSAEFNYSPTATSWSCASTMSSTSSILVLPNAGSSDTGSYDFTYHAQSCTPPYTPSSFSAHTTNFTIAATSLPDAATAVAESSSPTTTKSAASSPQFDVEIFGKIASFAVLTSLWTLL